jgi:hypothetical protein
VDDLALCIAIATGQTRLNRWRTRTRRASVLARTAKSPAASVEARSNVSVVQWFRRRPLFESQVVWGSLEEFPLWARRQRAGGQYLVVRVVEQDDLTGGTVHSQARDIGSQRRPMRKDIGDSCQNTHATRSPVLNPKSAAFIDGPGHRSNPPLPTDIEKYFAVSDTG